jgi:ABC-type transporter Mla maintaining outer membrane lipid asymmetry ATPase subunit MlaF
LPADALIRFRETRFPTTSGSVEGGDWEVSAGEVWFVAGSVGAGKTSLLRSIAGLERPVSGSIERFGDDWAKFSESDTLRHRRRIGVMFGREAGLFHRLNVLENIRLPLLYHGGCSRQKIDERTRNLLVALDLEKHALSPSVRISLSVARRTQLARALALEPEVLLLDDPCAGLDERNRRRLIRFLGRLHAGEVLAGNRGQPAALVVTGTRPGDWREFLGMKWARLHGGQLAAVPTVEQLVATAPELFHDSETNDSFD